MAHRDTGSRYEHLAAEWLQDRGLKLLASNYHCRRGEIDLIMEDGEYLCFVEVKYRASKAFGGAAQAITRSKQQKLLLAAEQYLSENSRHRNRPQRFDALLLQQAADGKIEVDWIRNAIESSGY